MPVTNVPAFPLRSSGLSQEAYSSQVEASLSAIPTAITDLNAVGSAYALATNATSTTSNTIGTGAKSFTTQTNLGYQVGQSLRIANTSTNFMTGEVTSYNTGTGALVMNISSTSGAGTFTSWFLSQSATGASSATAVSFTPAGTIAATNVQSAIQELDTEKLSSAAGAVTGTNLEDIKSAETVGSSYQIPIITTDINGRVTVSTTAAKITSGTSIATTSGTSHDYLSIPAGVKKITFMYSQISTNGAAVPIIQLGDSGGVETSGYVGSTTLVNTSANLSNGFALTSAEAAGYVSSGMLTICLLDAATNTWVANGVGGRSDGAANIYCGGSKALSVALDRIRLTTSSGTPTFDGGIINILLE